MSSHKAEHCNILHIIIGLDVGGAELMLKRLIEAHQGSPRFHHSVISLTGIGKVGVQLQAMGVDVQALGMRSSLAVPRVLWQLIRMMRAGRPDIVQTWMYHADLLGGLAARIAGNRNVIWGIRGTAIPQGRLSTTNFVLSLCSWLSRFIPRVIVCCAKSAQVAHAEKGYDQSKMVVIPNGYAPASITGNLKSRQQARADFGFSDEDVIVGIVGRFDPLKDHRNFVDAAAEVAAKVGQVKFLMVGRNIDRTNIALNAWLAASGFADKFLLLGERSDIPLCLTCMDVFCLSSSNEGFPNVVCEAMAMEVPCVVTDAGDAAEIVGDTGLVVAPRNASALAEALKNMINKGDAERRRLGGLARLRIENNYSMKIASARFEDIYRGVVHNL